MKLNIDMERVKHYYELISTGDISLAAIAKRQQRAKVADKLVEVASIKYARYLGKENGFSPA